MTVIGTAGARTLAGHTGAVNSVAFSPDGAWLSTASEDRTARLWNAATGDLRHTLSSHSDAVFAAPFSPDSTRLAYAARSGDTWMMVVDDLNGNVTHDPATDPLFRFPIEVDASGTVTITVGSICS